MKKTLEYYDKYANTFVEGTRDVDFSEIRNRFLNFLPEKARILDLGCGSGRDSAVFLELGYDAIPVDGSSSICRLAQQYLQVPVLNLRFDQLDFDNEFDGVWACASLLHLDKKALKPVMGKINQSLKNGSIF